MEGTPDARGIARRQGRRSPATAAVTEPFKPSERPWDTAMIPTPRGPGDLPVPPEEPRPTARGGEPNSLVLQALEEIEAVKRTLAELTKRLDALEHRVSTLETPKA